MVAKPNFKLIANGNDVSQSIKQDLIDIVFDDKEGNESDEIALCFSGIYARPSFGDSLELYLGYDNKLFKCGSFSVQTISNDFKANTTEIRATALNFNSNTKTKQTKSWENTDIFSIAKAIAAKNCLKIKTAGINQPIKSELQVEKNDIDFLYELAFKLGYLLSIKDNTIIISTKDSRIKEQNQALPHHKLDISELFSCQITDANKNAYDSIILSWHDPKSASTKSVKVGSGERVYKASIAEPKSDDEVLRLAKAKLDELSRGGISGRCECAGANIKAGGKLNISSIVGYENASFSIKSVRHSFSKRGYFLEISFEG